MRFAPPFRASRAALTGAVTATVALGLLLLAARVPAQQPAVAKPGPEHKVLQEEEGIWDATLADDKGKGTVMCKMGLNGIWLLEHFKADFGGMPFEGHGGTTYDSAKKKYINVWIDSMSTTPMVSEGTYDKATKTLTFVGKMPMPGGETVKATLVTVFKDANTKTFTVKGTGPDGKEFEMFSINYKRQSKD